MIEQLSHITESSRLGSTRGRIRTALACGVIALWAFADANGVRAQNVGQQNAGDEHVGNGAADVGAKGHGERTAEIRTISGTLSTGPTLGNANAYRVLAAQGYRAILSVDGRPCDVAAARAAGLAVAHVPVGYDRLDSDELAMLSRAFADLPRPLYIHCHHGRLRGPAVAALFLHWTGASADLVEGVLDESRFDTRYAGLMDSIRSDRPRAADSELMEISEVEPLTRAMLSLDEALAGLAESRLDEQRLLWQQAVSETERAAKTDPAWDLLQWQTASEVFAQTPYDVISIRKQCADCHAKNKWR